MDLQIDTRLIGGRVVVALVGVADLSTAPVLYQRLWRVGADHPGQSVAVDLDGLVALDDAALGLLLGAAARARESGGDLEVICTSERLRERLTVTRLDRCVTVRDRIAPASAPHDA